jgi:hypothetical protein
LNKSRLENEYVSLLPFTSRTKSNDEHLVIE